jgi:Skp family chaperone for outer membrane proteins
MKNTLLRWGSVLLLCGGLCAPALAQTKVGVIDLQKVFVGYWKTQKANAQITDRVTDYVKKRDEMMASYRASGEQYKELQVSAKDQSLGVEEREKRQRAVDAKFKELQESEVTFKQYERSMNETLNTQKDRMRASVLTEIQEVVARQAKAASYNLVFDIKADSQNLTPILLYNNGENDLTVSVLKELNASAPADFLKSLATNAPAVKGGK